MFLRSLFVVILIAIIPLGNQILFSQNKDSTKKILNNLIENKQERYLYIY